MKSPIKLLKLPVTIRFRGAKWKPQSLRADHVTGHRDGGNKPFYWDFTLGYDGIPQIYLEGGQIKGLEKGRRKAVGSVTESRLFPGELEKVNRLYGHPDLEKVVNATCIGLHSAYENEFVGLPHDTVAVWRINGSHDNWIIEHESGATLHVMNNDEICVQASTFQGALRKLFPDKKIVINRPSVRVEIV